MKTIEEILSIPRQKKEMTPELQEKVNKLKYGKTCPRCNGAGILPDYIYHKNGKCFACNGSGKVR